MTWQHITYFISVIITAAVMGFIAWYSRRNRDTVAGAGVYMWIALLVSLLSIFQGMSMVGPTMEWALFWFNMRIACFAAIPVLWLVFVLHYIGKQGLLSNLRIALLFIIPVITQVMLWTNDWHGLWVARDVGFRQAGPFFIPVTSVRVLGPWYKAHSLYTYGLMLAGLVILFAMSARMHRRHRGQAVMVGAGTLVMVIGALFPSFNLIPGMELNPLPQSFALGSLIIAWGLYRHRFLGVAPVYDEDKRIPRMLVMLFVLLTGGFLTVGFFYYRQYENHYRIEVERQLSTIAELKVNEITLWRKERLGDANILHGNAAFAGLVRRYFADPADENARWQIQRWIDKYLVRGEYIRVYLADTRGVIRMSAPDSLPPLAVPHLARDAAVLLASGQIEFQDLRRDSPGGPIHMAIMIPIIDDQNGRLPLGLIALRIDPAFYFYPLLKRWPTPSRTAETLIVRREGDDALFLNELRFRKNTALNLRMPLKNDTVAAVMAAKGREGIVVGVDYRGVPAIAALRSVPDSPWHLVARMDLEEVYAPVRERFWVMIIVVMVLVVGAGVGMGLLWRRQDERFYRERIEAAEALHETNEYLENLINYANAPIIVWDPRFRITRFNHAFESLTGRTADEVIGASIDILFPPELVESSMRLIRKTESGEHWETVEIKIISRDGPVKTVLWNSATIFARDGATPLATIAQGHDITERKRMEEVLRETNDYLENLFNYANAPIIVWDPRFKITRFNHAFELLTGRSAADVLGKSLEILFPPGQMNASMELIRITLTGERWDVVEINIQHADGSIRTVLWNSATLFSADGTTPIATIAQGQDITERKRMEDAVGVVMELSEFALAHSTDELLQNTLDKAELLTGSRIGFLHFLEPDQKTLRLQMWSTNTLENMCTAEGKGSHYDIDRAGVWVDCVRERRPVIHNDYANLPHRKGLPDGHAPVVRELVVPVMRNNRIVAIVGVGNKPVGYCPADVEIVSMLADKAWDIIVHKQAEEALRESEEKFSHAFQTSPYAITITSPEDGRFVDVNNAFYAITGYTRDDIAGGTSIGLRLWANEADRAHVVQELMNGRTVQGREFQFKKKNGEIINGLFSADSITLKSGRFILSSINDISERKGVEEKLRASEVRYRRLFEAAKDGILILDAESGMIVDVNPFLIEMLGYSHEQFLGKTIWDVWLFKDIIANKEKFLELQEKEFIRYEGLPLETADGRGIDVEFTSNFYEIENRKLAQCNIRDISERVRTQKTLNEISSHQKSLLSAIPDIVMEVDVNKMYTWANGPGIEFFGDDVIGREAAFYFEGEQDIYESVQPIFNGDENVIYLESWQRRRDGEKRLLAWWCSVLKNEKGELIGALSSARDITERRHAEEAIRTFTEELARSNVDLQQFAYVASHDLQEPLRMISSYLQLIERRYKDKLDQDANDFINFAVAGANRLQALISGLLDFSRVRTHGKPFESVNVNDVLDEVRKDLELQIAESGAMVAFADMPVIQADAVQISRLFQNLVQNAIKFRREGTPPLIDITADKGNDEYVFCVRDNGIGMEEKYLERIFVIFQRLHAREEYPGTGIGLSICKRIVERHGGRIWVESKPGEGSAFYFSIPAVPPTP